MFKQGVLPYTVIAPDGTFATPVNLHDDGMHNDGEYGDEFTHTLQAGGYSFLFRASGTSARGGQFTPEQVMGKTVITHPDITGGSAGPADKDCCTPRLRLLRIIIILLLVVVLLLLGKLWWSRQLRATELGKQSR